MSSYPSSDIERSAQAERDQTEPASFGAQVVEVEPFSPADDAGFSPGCVILSVDGHPLRDLIDWRWYSFDDCISVGYIDTAGDRGEIELQRSLDQDWGFSFKGVVFDQVKQCRNACTFCFMRQLPKGMRASLSLRDDDFRLSFLAGTFVTLSNLTLEDEKRIIEQHISPLRVSLHAVDSQVRRELIGPFAQAGLDALIRLLQAGIQVHAQIVLVPQVNDGEVLQETLSWAAKFPGILSIGIVPLGYTRYQTRFTHSFNSPEAALSVLRLIEPFQRQALERRGSAWVFAADEFYRNAYKEGVLDHLPPASFYADFDMFEDGIGILRYCCDDWNVAQKAGLVEKLASALRRAGFVAYYVCGFAMQESFPQLVAQSSLAGLLKPLLVKNNFFGGNVDVTGLLCACDVIAALQEVSQSSESSEEAQLKTLFLLPEVMFNDEGITLDGLTLEDMRMATELRLCLVSCTPSDFLSQILEIVDKSLLNF